MTFGIPPGGVAKHATVDNEIFKVHISYSCIRGSWDKLSHNRYNTTVDNEVFKIHVLAIAFKVPQGGQLSQFSGLPVRGTCLNSLYAPFGVLASNICLIIAIIMCSTTALYVIN